MYPRVSADFCVCIFFLCVFVGADLHTFVRGFPFAYYHYATACFVIHASTSFTYTYVSYVFFFFLCRLLLFTPYVTLPFTHIMYVCILIVLQGLNPCYCFFSLEAVLGVAHTSFLQGRCQVRLLKSAACGQPDQTE